MGRTFIIRTVHGRFYGHDIKRKWSSCYGRLVKFAMDKPDSSMVKKTAADSKSNEKNPRCTRNLRG